MDASAGEKRPFASQKAHDAGEKKIAVSHDRPRLRAINVLAAACIAVMLAYALSFLAAVPAVFTQSDDFSKDVSNCPGYSLDTVQESDTGLVASLSLAGSSCNAFGTDIQNLTVSVEYETAERLRVSISDTAKQQFTLPPQFFPRAFNESTSKSSSDLAFDYESTPFAFWITRVSDGDVLFDTRNTSLPSAPTTALDGEALNSFNLVFEDQYLQLTSALPKDANIYGLGEAVATSGFRRDVSTGNGTLQTFWARDIADPENENMYGMHAVYLEHRFNNDTGTSASHGVFLSSAAGADVLLTTPSGSNTSLVQYRTLGGTFDFYFFSGPKPVDVVEQYTKFIGLPAWNPYWAFGFHLCRWGYENINETMDVVQSMHDADIPLEVMWNDIDLYHDLRDFTSDPVRFPPEAMRSFIQSLAANGQHYIPILDAAVPHTANDSDLYWPFITGLEQGNFITNPDNTTYIGQVWPGYTVFADWFAPNVDAWWQEAIANWSDSGIEFSGLWLDMNEASSFCQGSCGSFGDLSNTSQPIDFPGDEGDPVTDWPEGYDAGRWGNSGNMTINGTLTFDEGVEITAASLPSFLRDAMEKRALGEVDVNAPPYSIHNGFGDLSVHTIATNATHVNGLVELDVHNLWGYMEERATHLALLNIRPNQRPFLISRSTFPSSGVWSGHWLGDNFSKWSYLRYNIQGVLQFQIFGIPMVGADTCGFNGNTDEELCNRWMSMSAFVPFYRNHNERGAISQEPFRWSSVAEASKAAMQVRYAMLPYWYTLFANASTRATPPVRALFWEFPNEPELLAVDLQFMIGRDILVSPVTSPNVTTVDAYFPGENTTWRDWYTHEVVDTTPGTPTTLSAPLSHIPVHIRSGSILLLHAHPAYTTKETRSKPYTLLVSLDNDGQAFGTAYIDDGESNPDSNGFISNRTLTFSANGGGISIKGAGGFNVEQSIESITVLGVTSSPSSVSVSGGGSASVAYDLDVQRVNVTGLSLELNEDASISWA
ncbi:glycoside hydrolase family 31 protein [Peniophora sp. CONT]|nr:glycoside hydrolase family 31 protein [Peniophora sp. CONT]